MTRQQKRHSRGAPNDLLDVQIFTILETFGQLLQDTDKDVDKVQDKEKDLQRIPSESYPRDVLHLTLTIPTGQLEMRI